MTEKDGGEDDACGGEGSSADPRLPISADRRGAAEELRAPDKSIEANDVGGASLSGGGAWLHVGGASLSGWSLTTCRLGVVTRGQSLSPCGRGLSAYGRGLFACGRGHSAYGRGFSDLHVLLYILLTHWS